MLDLFLSPFEQLAKAWRAEVARRRQRTVHDPVADSMERDAAELETVIAQQRRDCKLLTPDQYAPLVGRSERTVRRWCRTGRIPGAVQDAAGDWHVPATSRPQRSAA